MIPVSVLTGFLGSGKTTLLAKLLRHPGFSRTAVVINEFGEVGLDHDLIATSDESFITLQTGCLCCAIRGDLVKTLEDLLERRAAGTVPPFERVVIETTGLADPAPILQALITDKAVAPHLALSGVVTTVDAMHGLTTLERQPESVKQAAVADRLILTKTDMTGPAPLALTDRLRSLNPAAPVIVASHGEIAPERLFDGGLYNPSTRTADVQRWLAVEAHEHGHHHGLSPHSSWPGPDPATQGPHGIRVVQAALDGRLKAGHDEESGSKGRDLSSAPHPDPLPASGEKEATARDAHAPVHHHHYHPSPHAAEIGHFVIRRAAPIHAVTLTLFLEALAEHCGADLLRVKGIVNIAESAERPAVIHGVQHVFHPPAWLEAWPSADRTTRIVLITRGVSRRFVEALIDALEEEVQEVAGAPL